jgi:hypothetical protein
VLQSGSHRDDWRLIFIIFPNKLLASDYSAQRSARTRYQKGSKDKGFTNSSFWRLLVPLFQGTYNFWLFIEFWRQKMYTYIKIFKSASK